MKSEEFLTKADWDAAQKLFEGGKSSEWFANVLEHEPVLAEAVATRTGQLHATIDAQHLLPEVKLLMRTQSMRMVMETMALMDCRYRKVMDGLLPKSDLGVKRRKSRSATRNKG